MKPTKVCVPTYFGVAPQKSLISTKSCRIWYHNIKVAVRNFSKNGLSQITFTAFVMPKAVKMRWVVSNDHSKFLFNHIISVQLLMPIPSASSKILVPYYLSIRFRNEGLCTKVTHSSEFMQKRFKLHK